MTGIQAKARELLIAHISRFATYHGQKETMTWGAATLHVVAVSILLGTGRGPFWHLAPWWKFWPFVALLAGTAFIAFRFVKRQFDRRHAAAKLVNACSNVLTRWVLNEPEHDSCALVRLGEYGFASDGKDWQVMPKAVIEELREVRQLETPKCGQGGLKRWLHDDQNLT